jgi:hypothetical protein
MNREIALKIMNCLSEIDRQCEEMEKIILELKNSGYGVNTFMLLSICISLERNQTKIMEYQN